MPLQERIALGHYLIIPELMQATGLTRAEIRRVVEPYGKCRLPDLHERIAKLNAAEARIEICDLHREDAL
jgi:hypothetical protein